MLIVYHALKPYAITITHMLHWCNSVERTDRAVTRCRKLIIGYLIYYTNVLSMQHMTNKPIKMSTALSNHIWSLKDNKVNYKVDWKIITRGRPYYPTNKNCKPCTKEKYYIIRRPEMATLNNRNELASKCRHRYKYLLSNASVRIRYWSLTPVKINILTKLYTAVFTVK